MNRTLLDINLDGFNCKTVKFIEPDFDWRDNLIGITVYFTDETALSINASGEDNELNIY